MSDDEKIGKFQILGTLGQGAHSTILHVRRQADGKQYALKVVPIGEPEDKKFLEQAEHEFAVSQKLDHPNLVKLHALETRRTGSSASRRRTCSSSTSTARRSTRCRRCRCRSWSSCFGQIAGAGWPTCTAGASARRHEAEQRHAQRGPAR